MSVLASEITQTEGLGNGGGVSLGNAVFGEALTGRYALCYWAFLKAILA